ncbi:hypothetical protein [Actinacidiphila bryophytorum]|uniref:Uncharacterized protein n=1 Tax=Actinacidiphila bryophytorum TaxID=1436133 RepID=A0A9W4H6Q1_9ACTN|nr:hypothetical protein [Actinacidiphila bryophytorum]MBM9436851.1 hypothetical protein [Actinacidiphila bryophytorum]MBN6544501.1 hypothetical protein [Actinacidiphila bryophytorum]CAG7654555.1 conserved hypothetical protein [Actinacidiphila bryophytorum]
MATYLRGALIAFTPTALIPLPNIIVFQYNPETMTHTWTQQPVSPAGGQVKGNPLAVTGLPGEAFGFTLAMDSNDSIADGKKVSGTLAKVSGVATRLAALEMLVRPAATKGGTLVGTVTAGLAGLGKKKEPAAEVPANRLPVVLFVWGPGRVVPVRVTTLTITERLYDPLLNPTHAEAQLGLQVLTGADVTGIGGGPLAAVANAADVYTDSLREVLALANLANATESVIGMVPH